MARGKPLSSCDVTGMAEGAPQAQTQTANLLKRHTDRAQEATAGCAFIYTENRVLSLCTIKQTL